jgi:hypothetical protein
MSVPGQKAKYSRRADVFRHPKTGHRSMQSACPKRADFVAKAGCCRLGRCIAPWRAAVLTHRRRRSYATSTLGDAQNLSGWRPSDHCCKPPEVLSYGGENELILGASRAAQSKPTEPQDALQVREPHLDLLAIAARLLEALGAGE